MAIGISERMLNVIVISYGREGKDIEDIEHIREPPREKTHCVQKVCWRGTTVGGESPGATGLKLHIVRDLRQAFSWSRQARAASRHAMVVPNSPLTTGGRNITAGYIQSCNGMLHALDENNRERRAEPNLAAAERLLN